MIVFGVDDEVEEGEAVVEEGEEEEEVSLRSS